MSGLRVLWLGVWALWLGASVLERVVHRDRLARFRAVHARWRESSRTLTPRQRREVARAVRRGEAVADPSLADAAVDLAEAVSTRPPPSRLRRTVDTLFLAWLLVPVVIAAVRQEWAWLAITLLAVVFFGALMVVASRPDTGAQAALVANRRIPPPTRPPADPTAVNLGIGLPKSVARARRQTDRRSAGG